MRTRGQKKKQKQQGLPSSPPLQLATPPRRPRVIKKASAPVRQSKNATVEPSSEITFNSTSPISPLKTPRQPKTLGASSANDADAAPNGSPTLPTAITASSIAVDATSVPYGSPQSRAPAKNPAVPHTILHLWLEANSEDLASARPATDPSISMAVPSDLVPDLLRYISSGANSTSASVLTLNVASIGISPKMPSSNKRKLSDDAETSEEAQRVRVEISQPPKRQKRKGVFSRMPLQDSDASNQIPTAAVTTPPDSFVPPTNFSKISRYSKDGSLQLGLAATSQSIPAAGSEASEAEPVAGDGEHRGGNEIVQGTSATTQTEAENEAIAETPRPSRWGLGDLLKSARSVSKFLPGFTPRAPSVPIPVAEADAPYSDSRPSPTPPAIVHSPNNAEGISGPNNAQSPRIERAQRDAPQTMATAESRDEAHAYPPQKSGTKGQGYIYANQKRGERTKLSEAYNGKAQEVFYDAEMRTTPGTKRKRIASPDIIPNPRGSGYGMDLDYFGCSSSDEGEEVITPTKARRPKHRRLHEPNSHETVRGDAGRAKPYTGGFFAPPTLSYEGGNVFDEVSAFETARAQAKKLTNEKADERRQKSVSPKTPITNLSGSFRVPSPSDSDSDEEDSPDGVAKHSRSPSSPSSPAELTVKFQTAPNPSIASPQKSLRTGRATTPQPKLSTTKAKSPPLSSPSKPVKSPPNTGPTTWTQPPPPRPKPSHAALPSVAAGDSEALARARKKALQHLPHKPSGLRASSRMSSPKILEDTANLVVEADATSTAPVSPSADKDTVLTTRSDNVVASKYGQSKTPEDTESIDSLFEDNGYDISTEHDVTKHAPVVSVTSNYIRDPKIEACLDATWTDKDTKQATDMFEGLYAAFLLKQ